ncbi:MAG: hypothetical protein A3C81_02070 [Candidatus Yanofskybacteria bacterium RIFCSPHIGHO2_02_FULL_46_19]|nr:MAG: hypothetical protein A3C81_02070 [Candidatus Yanofskybacteria bacterium RIFCSPHIGHO2_02_FULL_46_19]OGN27435.1 MAG: hypothetical protein A3B17_01525 [Candidatus Yanofskybacteria bacterium RIFCSPLOWO2_01_FULL_45_72]
MTKSFDPVQSRQKGFAHLILIVIIAAAATGGYWAWKNYSAGLKESEAAGAPIIKINKPSASSKWRLGNIKNIRYCSQNVSKANRKTAVVNLSLWDSTGTTILGRIMGNIAGQSGIQRCSSGNTPYLWTVGKVYSANGTLSILPIGSYVVKAIMTTGGSSYTGSSEVFNIVDPTAAQSD